MYRKMYGLPKGHPPKGMYQPRAERVERNLTAHLAAPPAMERSSTEPENDITEVVVPTVTETLGYGRSESRTPPAIEEEPSGSPAPPADESESTESTAQPATDASDGGLRTSRPARYSTRPRARLRPTERDVELWRRTLSDEGRERLSEMERERAETLGAESSRLSEAEVTALKAECLVVEDISLHVRENAFGHHTDMFPCTTRIKDPQLVVRRGDEFKLTLTFQRPWNGKDDDMRLLFKIGEEKNTRKGTYAKITLQEGDDTSYMTETPKRWGARILQQEGNTLSVSVYVPPDVIVGEWEYAIQTIHKTEEGKERQLYECEGAEEVIILLNPWSKDDLVYMENSKDLKEYIENEAGLVFCGSYNSIQSKPWDQGQFEPGILEACLYILRKAHDFEYSKRMGDPVDIARSLSRILNNCDDNGVLAGNWSGNYEGGVSPLKWKGSAPIIHQYIETGEPVKYGQCWVFSHLYTTVARALGLPCRSVTNFASAHDTNLTMTIDKYVDDDGEDVGYLNGDSVWNFHVWNEVWILRPDLSKLTGHANKYDGWHATDATPQEYSDNMMQCGPSPLTAIKEGDVHIGQDTKFIFAEVNAEYCTWRNDEPPLLLSVNSYRVGRKISTKWPNGGSVGYYFGRDDGVRLDLTHDYKYPEGSAAEREVVEKATMEGKMGEHLWTNQTGVEVVIREQSATPRVGVDIPLTIDVKNTTSERQSVRLRVSVRPMNYTGAIHGKNKIVNKLFEEELLGPGFSKSFEVTAEAEDIIKYCDESLSMKVMALCKIAGSTTDVYESDEVVVKTPGVGCKGPEGKVKAEEPFEVELTLKNPLRRQAMTGCELSLEGSVVPVDGEGFTNKNSTYSKKIDDLKPGEIRKVTVTVKANANPERSRERELNIGLESKELPDFVGNLHVDLD